MGKLSCQVNQKQYPENETDFSPPGRPQTSAVCDANILINKRSLVPGGEARDFSIYTFSQHDNRHKINLPAKKHKLSENVKLQSKSCNVSKTLNWEYNGTIPNNNNMYYKRSQDIPEYLKTDLKSTSCINDRYAYKSNSQNFHRFPKVHDDSEGKYS